MKKVAVHRVRPVRSSVALLQPSYGLGLSFSNTKPYHTPLGSMIEGYSEKKMKISILLIFVIPIDGAELVSSIHLLSK